MKLANISLAKKIIGSILAICIVATLSLFAVQHTLYSRNFEAILNDFQQSAAQRQRDAARDILREVMFATEGSLQRGEYVQFMNFAKQQEQVKEIQEFSFYGKTGKVELSSNSDMLGKPLEPEQWKKAQESPELIVDENQDTLAFFQPLRVDADMRRLNPDMQVKDLYGVLHLEFSKTQINRMLGAARADFEAGSRKMLGLFSFLSVAVAALVSVILGILMSRTVLRPLHKCLESVAALANQDFDKKCDIHGGDEVGQMAVAINRSIDATKKAFDDITEAAEREKQLQARQAEEQRRQAEQERQRQAAEAQQERLRLQQQRELEEAQAKEERKRAEADRLAAEMLRKKVDHLLEVVAAAAEGDLTKEVALRGTEPVDELAGGIGRMLTDLSAIILRITETAEQFREGARVVADGAQTLAEGAQTQSATIEQMNASIEELKRSIETVRANADAADAVAKQTNQLAHQGSKAVGESVEAMTLIRESSLQIGKIINVISEIASQTNLLALNAAIEAARAGEHGLGFAVVADEVRKLADRSNRAAKEISNLIKESTDRVERGVKLSEQTGQSLKQITEGVAGTAAKISEIASATVHQTSTAKEVSLAIAQVVRVTEGAAAGSEQMASSSEQLGAQSTTLHDLVKHFKTARHAADN